MSEPEKLAAAEQLEKDLGFRVLEWSEEQRKRHGKLSVAAGAVILGSFMIPLLLPSSRGERGPIQHALAR